MSEKYVNKGAFMTKTGTMVVVDETNVDQIVEDPVMRERMKEQLRVKPVGENQVLIEVECVGVCGSDVHYFHDGRLGSYVVEKDRDIPYMLGHECSGTVVEIGSAVRHLKVGDRVCCEPSVTCGRCDYCKSGHYNLCEQVRFWATPPIQGCYMKYVPFEADLCYRLPDGMDAVQGALIEPMATGMYAARLGRVTVGSTVVILGSGCIGLMMLRGRLAAAGRDPSDLHVVHRLDQPVEGLVLFALSSKAAAVLGRELTDGRGPDVVFETAGSKYTIAQTPHIARRGGRIVLVGMSAEAEISFNFGQVMAKELTIKSVFRYVNMFPTCVRAVACGLAPVEKVATHIYSLGQIQQAFEDSVHKKNEVVKAVIRFTD